ncbi:MAG: transcription-repair coupling factor [Clostridiales bacterium]|nr:transcription-repair coupling factor [Clostridiales bacterium]
MNVLSKQISSIPQFDGVLTCINKKQYPIGIKGLVDCSKPFFIYSLHQKTNKQMVIVTSSRVNAKKIYEQLQVFLDDSVIYIPARELVLHDIEAKSHQDELSRVKALFRLQSNDYKIAISSIDALCMKVTPKSKFAQSVIKIKSQQQIKMSQVIEKMLQIGYEMCDLVEASGQFSVRGDIIDVFSPGESNPIRIEFFDDEIDLIRHFDINSQRSIDSIDNITILPCHEQVVTKRDINYIVDTFLKGDELSEALIEEREKLSTGTYHLPIDKYFSLLPNRETPFDYIDKDAVIILDNDQKALIKMENVLMEYGLTCEKLLSLKKILPEAMDMLIDFHEAIIDKDLAILMPDVLGYDKQYTPDIEFNFLTRENMAYKGQLSLLLEDITKWRLHNRKIVLFTPTKKSGQLLMEYLGEHQLYPEHVKTLENKENLEDITIVDKGIFEGFEFLDAKLCVIGSGKIFRKSAKDTSKRKKGRDLDLFATLKVMDFVVHDVHGIGQYRGLKKIEVGGITKDYLHILYRNEDSVYIPVSKMELIQKFIGSDGRKPRLSKLGGVEWENAKKKVKANVKDIAKELIILYAKRAELKGYEFSEDNMWQMSFEEQFPYEETNDQLRCIEEIKNDMQSNIVMDRLLCGDVGYGKTEVALRAAFKAIMDGKQVAFLVPTTILAYQHYRNFIERLKDFPVKVDLLCRFRTKKQQGKTIELLKAGSIDIVVGTHRLIQKDVKFKDLGLLVIDEEQRFGVEHKEIIKNYKAVVDVLTLTATPIPRTLHMSLSGIRDISVIEDPPGHRFPVQTYVMEYDYDVMRDAIDREVARDGQVFYLYNRVKDMDLKYAKLKRILGDDISIGIAHGQLEEKKLEQVMLDFINKKFDVLLCTTIIESGLDMPNVNTIIVEDANRMGLSQLYQIRGRVGRSDKVAYAYITYQKGKVISEVATKRLEAIKEFTEFGSGFKIAMRDLEIRGAGNLLGAKQHGHFEKVGYDMYIRLLNKAVDELSGKTLDVLQKEEASVDILVDAYISDTYITNDIQRMDIYKRMAIISSEKQKSELIDELIDRFGDLPLACENLLDIALIKHYAQNHLFSNVTEKKIGLEFYYEKGALPNLQLITELADVLEEKVVFNAKHKLVITIYTKEKGKELMKLAKKVLEIMNEFELQ